jgi:3-hydroxyacyl-CoA dehydrogenase
MGTSKEVRNVAIVGTGVIGASWAALYLARGLNVIATDPAPNAEANLRRYVDGHGGISRSSDFPPTRRAII